MSQSECEPITSSQRKGKMRTCESRLVLGFSHWLKKWSEFCCLITERINAKPKQMQFTFDTQSETALCNSDSTSIQRADFAAIAYFSQKATSYPYLP